MKNPKKIEKKPIMKSCQNSLVDNISFIEKSCSSWCTTNFSSRSS